MIDVLLISPSYKDYEKERNGLFEVSNLGSCFPPLGLIYVGASCQNSGYNVKLIDMELEQMKISKLIKKIGKLKPKVIGISCASIIFPLVVEICNRIKQNYTTPIVIGGPHTFVDPEGIINTKSIDFVIRKEGEKSFSELLDYIIKDKGEISNIKNLTYKKEDKIINNQDAELIDLDKSPFPARNLLKIKKYYHMLSRSYKTTFLITSRGCPYSCIFCNPLYKKVRKRSVENVISEIKSIIKEYNINDLEFFDETFNLDKQWVINLCNQLINQNIKIKWRTRCRPDLLDEKVVNLMKKAGCYQISLGIESANDNILKFFKKGYNINQIKEAIKIIKRHKIEIHGYFIIGSPMETREEILNTINFPIEQKLDFVSHAILTPFAGTELFEIIKQNNWLLKDYSKNELLSKQLGVKTSMLKNQYLSNKEIEKLLKKAYVKFYLRPTKILSLIKMILSHPLTYSITFCKYMRRVI